MDQGHRLHAPLHLADRGARLRVRRLSELEFQQAGDHLQVVFDAVVDLAQQHLFLFQRLGEAIFGFLAPGDVALDYDQLLQLARRAGDGRERRGDPVRLAVGSLARLFEKRRGPFPKRLPNAKPFLGGDVAVCGERSIPARTGRQEIRAVTVAPLFQSQPRGLAKALVDPLDLAACARDENSVAGFAGDERKLLKLLVLRFDLGLPLFQ